MTSLRSHAHAVHAEHAELPYGSGSTRSEPTTLEVSDGDDEGRCLRGHERIVLEEKPMPECGPNDAIVKISLTTICGTDVHIWREEYPVEQGRIVGHEPVGMIHQLGEAVSGYEVGDRVLVGAITPCGSCFFCQSHNEAQCSGHEDTGRSSAAGGSATRSTASRPSTSASPTRRPTWRRSPTTSPTSSACCSPTSPRPASPPPRPPTCDRPDGRRLRAGPIGLCATAGARLSGASLVIGVDRSPAA